MDLTTSIEPRSDQINADDLIAGPATYTIREVIAGVAESPFDFKLVETDRAYRPSKTMRRVIVNAWGPEASNYNGRRLTLYREPSIRFGKDIVGGIRISHMSHIAGPVELMAQTTRGKREKFVVEPLPDTATSTPPPPAPNAELLDQIGKLADQAGVSRTSLAEEWAASHDGQPIRQAADLGGLELLRDDLAAKVGAE